MKMVKILSALLGSILFILAFYLFLDPKGGIVCPNLTKEEKEILEKSANLGNREAAFRLSRFYMFCGVDHKIGVDWLKQAAKMGQPVAQYNLGLDYERSQNREEAYKWFFESANNGVSPAMLKLAEYYQQGVGIERNIKTAITWYEKVVGKGWFDDSNIYFIRAVKELSKIYLDEDKRNRDLKKAYVYLVVEERMSPLDSPLVKDLREQSKELKKQLSELEIAEANQMIEKILNNKAKDQKQ